MNTRKCLILVFVMAILPIFGCQRSAVKKDAQPGETANVSPAQSSEADSDEAQIRYRTQRVRNPETGRIETRRIPVKIDEAAERRRAASSQADKKPAPYRVTLVIDGTVERVYTAIYDWAKKAVFDVNSDHDMFSGRIHCRTASNIHFNFELGLIDTNKTKLTVRAENYRGKDEFEMIRKSLEEVLAGLEETTGN